MFEIDNALIVRLLDLVGIGVFALSGALMAVRLRQTLVTAATGVPVPSHCSSKNSPDASAAAVT